MSASNKRYLFATLLSVAMVLAAELIGEKEIIFPEIIALLIGAWVSPRQPWRVGKPVLPALMTISAVVGVCIVRYLPVPLLLQVGAAFLFVGISLLLCRSTLAPMLSACILPVLLHTTSWIYPVSVLAATLLIVLGRWGMEHFGLVETPLKAVDETPLQKSALHWLYLFLLFVPLSAIPVMTRQLYLIAPPLLVLFVEFSSPGAKVREHKWPILALVAFAAVLGSASKWMLVDLLGLPLTVSALATVLCLFVVMTKAELFCPPVGAIAFLPLILPTQGLWRYPLEVCAGALAFMAAAILCFPAAQQTAQPTEALFEELEEKQSV